MWGVVAGVLGAAVALSLAQTYLQNGRGPADSDQPRKGPAGGLPEPDKHAKPRPPDGEFRASLWQELSPQEAAKRAKRWFKK